MNQFNDILARKLDEMIVAGAKSFMEPHPLTVERHDIFNDPFNGMARSTSSSPCVNDGSLVGDVISGRKLDVAFLEHNSTGRNANDLHLQIEYQI